MIAEQHPIVIVDDDEDDRELLTTVLRKVGVLRPIVPFENAGAALSFLRQEQQPCLIISDINMPGESGIAFRRQIEHDPLIKNKNIPFIFLTTVAQPHGLDSLIQEIGAIGLFEKPTTVERFRSLMEEVLQYWNIL